MNDGLSRFDKRQAVRAIDVARAAGVSQSSVSRVFQGGSVATKRRDKILEAANALGYRPDAMARAMITRRSGIVGILMNSNTNLYYPDVLTALCRAISDQKMLSMVFTVETAVDIDYAVEQALAYRVDGIIALTDITIKHTEALSQLGTILVLYNREIMGAAANCVGCDHEYDGEMLGRHVVSKGASIIWVIEGPETSSLAKKRLAGLLRGLQSSASEIRICSETGDFSFESGFSSVVRRLAAEEVKPHTIIAVNDMMAMGAVEALRMANIPAQDQILVAGFDGIAATRWRCFQITTMAQPLEQLAAAAVAIIVSRQESGSSRLEQRIFSSQLVTRLT